MQSRSSAFRALVPTSLLASIACQSVAPSASATQDRTGTNPTLLLSTAELANRYSSQGDDSVALELVPSYQHSFADGSMRIGLAAPVRAVEREGEGEVGLGDVALRYEWLAHLDEDRGVVFFTDVSFDTASEAALGEGRTLIGPALTSAHFLSETSLLAFTYQQLFGADGDTGGEQVNRALLDARYVRTDESLRRWWLVEPSLVVDFEAEAETWGALAFERGWTIGEAEGGGLGAYLRPELGLGGRRELDWSLLLGVRLVGL